MPRDPDGPLTPLEQAFVRNVANAIVSEIRAESERPQLLFLDSWSMKVTVIIEHQEAA